MSYLINEKKNKKDIFRNTGISKTQFSYVKAFQYKMVTCSAKTYFQAYFSS